MAYTTINKSTAHFDTKLYAGSASNVTVSGLGFQPNWIWLKNRSATDNHVVVDSVRGSGSYGFKNLYPNLTDQEYVPADGNASVLSIASSSFVVGQNTNTNGNGENFVAWNWKAGTTSGLSGGTITPTGYSINATSGFGIYKYTGNGTSGATIAHGLGKVPQMIIVKRTDAAPNWQIYHAYAGNTKFLEFTSGAQQTATNRWNDTTPTSSVFSLGNDSDVNGNGNTYIAYVFCNVQGYCKIGNYHGNGQNDGSFIYTGFKPKFILIKSNTRSSSWDISDFERIGYNPKNYRLTPHNNAAAYTGVEIYKDYLSNGFKIRASDTDTNEDGRNYLYMAFGQSLVGTNNVPATAR